MLTVAGRDRTVDGAAFKVQLQLLNRCVYRIIKVTIQFLVPEVIGSHSRRCIRNLLPFIRTHVTNGPLVVVMQGDLIGLTGIIGFHQMYDLQPAGSAALIDHSTIHVDYRAVAEDLTTLNQKYGISNMQLRSGQNVQRARTVGVPEETIVIRVNYRISLRNVPIAVCFGIQKVIFAQHIIQIFLRAGAHIVGGAPAGNNDGIVRNVKITAQNVTAGIAQGIHRIARTKISGKEPFLSLRGNFCGGIDNILLNIRGFIAGVYTPTIAFPISVIEGHGRCPQCIGAADSTASSQHPRGRGHTLFVVLVPGLVVCTTGYDLRILHQHIRFGRG